MIQQLRQILSLLEGNGHFITIALGLALLSSAMDVLGMLLLPVFLLITLYPAGEMASFPRIGVANWAFDMREEALLALMVLVFLVKGGLAVLSAYVTNRLGQRVRKIVGLRLARQYLSCPLEEMVDRPLSEILSVISSHADIFSSQVVMSLLRLLQNAIMALVIVSFLGYIEPTVLAVMVPVLAVLGGLFLWTVRRKTAELTVQLTSAHREYQRQVAYAFRGPREVRLLQLQDSFLNRLGSTLHARGTASAGLAAVNASPRAIGEFSAVCLALGYMVHKNRAQVHSSEIVAHMGIYAFAGVRLISCFSQIMASVAMIRAGARVVETLANELQKLRGAAQPVIPILAPGARKERFETLAVEQLGFRYQESAEPVLQGLDFTLHRNESVGIMGASGVGKSTLLDILLGLLLPQQGVVFVNGEPTQLSSPQWWSRVGYVPQAPFIANDSFANNVAFGAPSGKVDAQRLEKVVKMAHLESVIDSLPDGLDSHVGDLGIKLSGGQRQRLAIARALYFEREILVFDEATSSLDEKTEAEIVDAIESIRQDVTTLVVAHRKSTLRHCDRILKLEGGKLHEISLDDD